MIEMRWLEREGFVPNEWVSRTYRVLQFRTCTSYADAVTGFVTHSEIWSDWQDVPTVNQGVPAR